MSFHLQDIASADGRESAISFPDLLALLLAAGPAGPGRVDVVDVDLERVQVEIGQASRVLQTQSAATDDARTEQMSIRFLNSRCCRRHILKAKKRSVLLFSFVNETH